MINCDHAVTTPFLTDENEVIQRLVSILPIRTIREGISAVNNNENRGSAISFWSDDVTDVLSAPFTLQVRAFFR